MESPEIELNCCVCVGHVSVRHRVGAVRRPVQSPAGATGYAYGMPATVSPWDMCGWLLSAMAGRLAYSYEPLTRARACV